MSQSDDQPQQEPSASKKIRMTTACERCRSKKVKCDFSHPSCSRCQQAKAQCSYDGSATQVDLFNLVKLNETVDLLQKRVQSIESGMKDVSTNTQYVADTVRLGQTYDHLLCNKASMVSSSSSSSSSSSNSLPKWSLSLTPSGLRIDTNIISIHALYDILAASSSPGRLDTNTGFSSQATGRQGSDTSTSAPAGSASAIDRTTTITRKKDVWKTRLKTFPLYSTWEPPSRCQHRPDSVTTSGPGRMSREELDRMMEIYSECLLCFPCPDPANSVARRYKQGRLDPLLKNVVFAWTARHGAIYHGLFPGQDPNEVGAGFFERAKELLKDRFTRTSVDTMHSLLIMYIYAIGQSGRQRPGSSESEAYMYLGLAIRMCLDMKMYKDGPAAETNRRFFWAVYFLETLCTIHSDRVFGLPAEDAITVGFPTVLGHEDGEKRWRVLFAAERFKITRIYRNMLSKTAQEKPLLSSISTVESDLQDWYRHLPDELQYRPGDIHRRNWRSTSFREQACVKLNSEYHFQLCQLYRLFAATGAAAEPAPEADARNPIERVAQERCLGSADTLVELLECYARLDQAWCHFSLETVMIPILVYSRLLADPHGQPDKVVWAHRQLDRMVAVLATCPIRHHRYVGALAQRIKKLLVRRRPDPSGPAGVNDEDELDLTTEEEEVGPIKMEDEPAAAVPAYDPQGTLSDLDGRKETGPFFQLKDPAAVDVLQLSEFLYGPSLMAMCSGDQASAAYDTSSFNNYFGPQFLAPSSIPQQQQQHPQQPQAVTVFDTTQSYLPTSPLNIIPIHPYPVHKRPDEDGRSFYG